MFEFSVPARFNALRLQEPRKIFLFALSIFIYNELAGAVDLLAVYRKR
jgi:hypothetical protein